ncbi:MAG: flagellar basal body P-ring formation protein FlgA [Deltaproteobacteria bacterium]|nr:flagellar basal body P-ring formation protein FlgA [Deltaproteobacteria bacterium]MBI3293989.1 flagellar basal body P-ring formation protein FlgA [Deltaproteobacteria bacterium]
MILVFLFNTLLMAGPHPLEKAIREKGWCTHGLGIEKLATSRRWISTPAERVVVLTDPPIGTVRFEVAGTHVSGTAYVTCREMVAAAVKDLGPGEAFTPENVKWVENDVAFLSRSGFFRAPEELRNLESRGFIRAGTVLSRMQVQNARWVVAGSPVEIIHQGPSLKITARGKALQSGSRNDWIRVENFQTHKMVLAQVVQPSTVMTRGSHAAN